MMRVILILSLIVALTTTVSASAFRCPPTRPDSDGPFYREGAPVRNKIGEGYLLMGEVKSAADCRAIADARIEVWMTGPDGRYEERWRATLFSSENGRYYFQSHVPGPFGTRPPHIHMVVNAPGFEELVTQHYPVQGSAEAVFDLVLIPTSPRQ